MSLTNFDLFGHPVAAPQSVVTRPVRSRVVPLETKRTKLIRHLEQSKNLVLFDELLEFLTAPLLKVEIPTEFASEIGSVAVIEVDDDEDELAESVEIPYEPWDTPWVTDARGHHTSKEGVRFMQVRVFWRSMEELALSNNELDKWSVLRWIFRPAIWKYYVWDKRIGRSHCLAVHENDEPFGFHQCCMAARIDEDAVREGVRRNIPAAVIKAVERVCKFD